MILKFVFAAIFVLVSLVPLLPVLVLIPWYFVARHRGLTPRSKARCRVALSDGQIQVSRGSGQRSLSLPGIARARLARNSNWTESKLLEDALGLFDQQGREVLRLPESAEGLPALLAALRDRDVPVERIDVSAPAFLD